MKILLTVVNFLATLGKNVGQTPTNADECLVIGERVFLGKEYEAREDLAPSSMGIMITYLPPEAIWFYQQEARIS